jgi:hypothetical protein
LARVAEKIEEDLTEFGGVGVEAADRFGAGDLERVAASVAERLD